jgi:hypothetical protein
MPGDHRRGPEGRIIKPPRSPRDKKQENVDDWHVSKRVQDRILKRQEDRRKREEAFRQRRRGRIW